MIERRKIYNFLNQQKSLFGNELFSLSTNQVNPDLLSHVQNSLDGLNQYSKSISLCQECSLGAKRNNFVFGVGDSNAELMLIGEAPRKEEDMEGEPFVGRAGKLLNKILAAINKNRLEGVYLANILKCRPPDNRDPLSLEVDKCEPYLLKQIEMIKPKLIMALGKVSAKILLKKEIPIDKMRSTVYDYYGTPLRVTYHPDTLLRNPDFKKFAWEDFQWARDYLAR
ncbi:MAG: uracil-DNA glycosylase [Candidatus Marinimicrobia bacterium]|nr:uracil-DNA glycosylase [Candidatus Neomarinimicrobiota bacterium]MAV96330.1 uracil-DNA glycosylase [Candidatus Neomarinimicrobiota bacterium]|tara:strand:- start:168 stop:842 length:675 start_codon:yes stop_codon:yes gene_type:complete